MRKRLSIILGLSVFVVLFVTGINCAKKDSETTPSTNITSATVNNMTAVSASYKPASLAFGTSLNGKVGTYTSDFCNGDFFACQPLLLKLYITASKQYFDMATTIVSVLGTVLGNLADGQSGQHEDTAKNVVIYYSKTSSTIFNVLAKYNSTPYMDINVNGTEINVKADFSAFPPADRDADTPTVGTFEVALSVTDVNNWISTVTFLNMADCTGAEGDADPRKPKNLRIHMAKADGLWTGKAMLYNGRWSYFNHPTLPICTTAASDAAAMNLYTDFVANNAATKAKVYLIPRTATDFLTNANNYELSDLCNHYYGQFFNGSTTTPVFANAGACSTAVASYYPSFSSLVNPFCTQSLTTTNWNSDCTGVDATVQAAAYGASSLWIAPNEFYNTTAITLRTSL